ncbi:MAG: nickel pincer cofactor biosynthesis protein LarC [Thermoguttaceae bacterium]
MQTIHFDCAAGISGDMTLGALVDLGVPLSVLQTAVASLGAGDVVLTQREVERCHFRAIKVDVTEGDSHHHHHHEHEHHHHEHSHRGLAEILEMIRTSGLTPRAKSLATKIFERLGDAEAHVHGTPVEKIHFHEVGAIDSIADIVGVAAGIDFLGIERFTSSPVAVGSGFVEIAHGRCAVPVPAVARLLAGVPIVASPVAKELTTPTGAAILATLVSEFGSLPPMRLNRVGCGAGSRNTPEQPNILRIFLGESVASGFVSSLVQLECNIDDATGEEIAFALERLRELGVRDAWATAISMKKGRPAVTVSVLCDEPQCGLVESVLFRETTTLGVRRFPVARTELARRGETLETPWGTLKVKIATLPDGSERVAAEYESARELAIQHGVALGDVLSFARSVVYNSG